MFNKFESMCESILESNKSDMEQLRDSMKEAFGLKDQNFSAVNILPDNTARMQLIVPGNKQFTDEVSIIDAKNGKFLINSLKLQDEKTTSVEKAIEYLTANDGDEEAPEDEGEEQSSENKEGEEEKAPEETPAPEEGGEEAPKPEEAPKEEPKPEEAPKETPTPEEGGEEAPKPEEEEDEEKKKEEENI